MFQNWKTTQIIVVTEIKIVFKVRCSTALNGCYVMLNIDLLAQQSIFQLLVHIQLKHIDHRSTQQFIAIFALFWQSGIITT